MTSEPGPGEYHRSARTDWMGRPDTETVDLRWRDLKGKLHWAFGIDVAFLAMVEAQLTAARADAEEAERGKAIALDQWDECRTALYAAEADASEHSGVPHSQGGKINA